MKSNKQNFTLIKQYFLFHMVTQPTLRTCEGKQVNFGGEKIRYVTALDLNKCLEQIKSTEINCDHSASAPLLLSCLLI